MMKTWTDQSKLVQAYKLKLSCDPVARVQRYIFSIRHGLLNPELSSSSMLMYNNVIKIIAYQLVCL